MSPDSALDLKFTTKPDSWLITGVQGEIKRRMRYIEGELRGDLSGLRFEQRDYPHTGTSIRGSIDLNGLPIGFTLIQISWWPWQPMALYGGIALCDGTSIELVAFKKQRDILRVFIDGGRDCFELIGLVDGFAFGDETSIRWSHGSLPRAFQAPWLGGTDWHLSESVRFKIGKPDLTQHETLPYVTLCALSCYRLECWRRDS